MTASVVFALLLALACCPISQAAQSYPGSGLEVDDAHVLPYVIDDLPAGAAALGVTTERIADVVEARLRRAGIRPESEVLRDYHLLVRIRIAGQAFQVSLLFVRTVTYTSRETRFVLAAPTWEAGSIGALESNAANVVASLDPLLDRFLTAFLAVNQSY